MDDKMNQIFDAFQNRNCIVLKNYINYDTPGNSEVFAISAPLPIDLLQKCISHFSMLKGIKRDLNLFDFKIGLNVVRIDGNEIAKEGLHVHLSHIIAIVFEGEGILEWESQDGKKQAVTAKKFDCVIIPRGTLHYFTGNLSFSALEFSDIIDYQKHHYTSIE